MWVRNRAAFAKQWGSIAHSCTHMGDGKPRKRRRPHLGAKTMRNKMERAGETISILLEKGRAHPSSACRAVDGLAPGRKTGKASLRESCALVLWRAGNQESSSAQQVRQSGQLPAYKNTDREPKPLWRERPLGATGPRSWFLLSNLYPFARHNARLADSAPNGRLCRSRGNFIPVLTS